MGGAVKLMIEGRMVLGAVVGPVEVSGGPVESELTLGITAPEPVKTYIHQLGLLGDDGFVCDSNGSGIVSLDWGLRLGPTHLDEGLAQRDHSLGGNENGGQLGLSGGGDDKLDYFRNDENGTIEGRGWAVLGKEDVGTSAAAPLGLVKVAGIGVIGEHVGRLRFLR